MSKMLNYTFIFLLVLITSINSFKQNNDNNNMKQVHIFTEESNLNDYIEDVYDDDDDDDDLVTKDKNCNMTEYPEQAIRCDLNHMTCTDTKYLHHCSCNDGYITYPRNNSLYCNLEQKKQAIAFTLELCAGFGAGHFYRAAYLMGALKLAAFIFGLVFICTFPITAKCVSDCDCEPIAVCLSIVYYLYLCGLAVWYIIDLVNFGNNNYNDLTYMSELNQEIKMKPW